MTTAYNGKRTQCPVTRDEFINHARKLKATMSQPAVGDKAAIEDTVDLPVKLFSTGSFGWYASGKVTIYVDGKPVLCQLGINLTVVGSKEQSQASAS